MLRKNLLSAAVSVASQRMIPDDEVEPLDCPYCPNQGWYTDTNSFTGEPEQVQCEFCECEENSKFNKMRSE